MRVFTVRVFMVYLYAHRNVSTIHSTGHNTENRAQGTQHRAQHSASCGPPANVRGMISSAQHSPADTTQRWSYVCFVIEYGTNMRIRATHVCFSVVP